MDRASRPFTTPSDLAEYAYCPRARHYRLSFGEPASTPERSSGVRFHARTLRGVRRRDRHVLLLVGLAALGVAILALGLGGTLG